jgi:hypothetical protein
MKNYLLMDKAGLVQNLVVWNGEDAMTLPPGWTAVERGPNEYFEFGKPRGIPAPPTPPGR